MPLHARAEHLEGQVLAEALQQVDVGGVGVPEPFAHVGDPALPPRLLDLAHDVVVAERVEPAEDLPHDADERAGIGEVGRDVAQHPPSADEGFLDAGHPLLRVLPAGFDRGAEVGQRRLVRRVGRPFLQFIRTGPQQKLRQKLAGDHRPPRRAKKLVRMLPDPAVPVRARRRDDRDAVEPHLLQDPLDIGAVLAETARSVRGGHEERHPVGFDPAVHEKFQRVPQRHLEGKALLAGGVASPEDHRLLVGGRHRFRVDPHGAERGGDDADPRLRHRGEEDRPAGQRRTAHCCAHGRSTPLLSR